MIRNKISRVCVLTSNYISPDTGSANPWSLFELQLRATAQETIIGAVYVDLYNNNFLVFQNIQFFYFFVFEICSHLASDSCDSNRCSHVLHVYGYHTFMFAFALFDSLGGHVTRVGMETSIIS